MENESQKMHLLHQLDRAIPSLVNPSESQNIKDLSLFRQLYRQFLEDPHKVTWDQIKPMTPEAQLPYEHLPHVEGMAERSAILERIAVVKLNGGLGTTMGCSGPKSLVEVRDGLNFLDFALQQHRILLNSSNLSSSVPLLLMNSFNTDAQTNIYLQRQSADVLGAVKCFCQAKCPRIFADSLRPIPTSWDDRLEDGWYPPGHGNAFWAMDQSGLLDELLANGKDLAFFANIDNTSAIVDERIAKVLADGRADYVMEMTQRTTADVKLDGGKRLMHLECPQVPAERLEEFCSLRTFKMFNTNNIWVNLRVVKQRLNEFKMEIVANAKSLCDGQRVLQLEQSIGGAIRNFPGRALAICVPRQRFLPVKSTRDLFRVRCPDLFELCPDQFVMRQRVSVLPNVHFSDHFARLADFELRIPQMPKMAEVKSIRLEGDVWLGKGVTMKGIVEVRADTQTPPGAVRVEDNSIIGLAEHAELRLPRHTGDSLNLRKINTSPH
uniref:UTP--glucose-1-phosphate uridylyltransferase n=1 Tax=Globodera pallida TaxID=36090 RepID=A0A183BQM0_GLOPA